MKIDYLIQSYRLFDITSGILETNERIRNDLLKIQVQQIKSQKKSIIERALLMFGALITGVPILYGFIPESMSYKNIVIIVFVLIVLAYWLLNFFSYLEERKNSDDIELELKISRTDPLEESPRFILLLASTYVTRHSLARDIAESNNSDNETKEKFKRIVNYWESQIKDLLKEVKKLHKKKKLSNESYDMIKNWLQISHNS